MLDDGPTIISLAVQNEHLSFISFLENGMQFSKATIKQLKNRQNVELGAYFGSLLQIHNPLL